jgi:hypothetical protein
MLNVASKTLTLNVENEPLMLSLVMLDVIMLSVVMLDVIMLSVIMLDVIMLNFVMLDVIMLSVGAPGGGAIISCLNNFLKKRLAVASLEGHVAFIKLFVFVTKACKFGAEKSH